MLYDFNIWNDDSQELVRNFLVNSLRRLRDAGLKLGQEKHFIQGLDEQIKHVEEGGYLRNLSCEFSIPRTDESSWSNSVRVRVDIDEDHNFRREERKAKKERRGVQGQRYKGVVECRPHINGEKPQDAARFARLLADVAALTVELDSDLEVLIRRVGNYPIDEAKEKARDELYERRSFIRDQLSNELSGAKGYLHLHVRELVDSLIDNEFKTVEGLTTTLTRRFEGKERKFLNKVPSSVFKVTHVRGGASTVTLTAKTIDCLELRLAEEAAKAEAA